MDWGTLKMLNEAHLREMGFPLGPRVKILNTINNYNESSFVGANAPLGPPPAVVPSPLAANPLALQQVRRAAGTCLLLTI